MVSNSDARKQVADEVMSLIRAEINHVMKNGKKIEGEFAGSEQRMIV